MDLYELEREKKYLENDILSKQERIELERSRLECTAIDYTKPSVQSTPRNDSMINAVARIVEMEKDIEYLEKKLNQNQTEIDRLYNTFKEFRERDKQIYVEKKIYGWSNSKISAKHGGISKRYINKIIKNMKKSEKN